MEQTWPTQTVINELSHHGDESEQTQYQQDVFRTLLKWVTVICAVLGCAYLLPFIRQGSWAALLISLNLLTISGFSAVGLRLVNEQNFTVFVRLWLALATSTVCTFGFLQSDDFIHIMALGATVVIVLAIFLEPTRISYGWAIGNVAGYILAVLLRGSIHVPEFDLGVLRPLVVYATPVAILIILTELGRVTTQHFKFSLIQSEARRKQLEIQEKQLRALMVDAERARAKAERADRIKSAFLANVSHELRTPLNAVINFTRFVIDGDTGPVNEEQRELLTEVVGSARHLLNLINDVLDMSKIEAGSLALFIEDGINLNTILNDVASMGRSLLAKKPVRLKTAVDEYLPLIRGDQQRILQILLNILSNACKFTDEGEITIGARHSGDAVILSVKDTGPGIAPEDHAMVFGAFKQTQAGLRHGGGTGLGMAIAKSLAEAHGGRLWLESEPGNGATFYVSLPIKSETLAPARLSGRLA